MTTTWRFGAFAPQGWKTELAGIDGAAAQWQRCLDTTLTAEQLGYDSIWLYDHFHNVPTPAHEAVFECWTTMAALAQATTTIRLGQMVSCTSYRPPTLTAKITSSLDVISGGRLDWGVGAGWYEHEYRAYGYEFPDTPTRLRMLGEALQVIHAMWRDPYASFEGRHYRIDGAINEPKGVQQPHPPIWVGGAGEKVTLRLAAQYGDVTNFGGHLDDMAWYQHKFDVIAGHCEAVGRDPAELTRSSDVETTLLRPGDDPEALTRTYRRDQTLEQYRSHAIVGGPQEVIDTYGRLVDAGVEYIIISDVPGLATTDILESLAADVLPAFASLRAG
jgi:F420-dependent oxidoreductase-like protein